MDLLTQPERILLARDRAAEAAKRRELRREEEPEEEEEDPATPQPEAEPEPRKRQVKQLRWFFQMSN